MQLNLGFLETRAARKNIWQTLERETRESVVESLARLIVKSATTDEDAEEAAGSLMVSDSAAANQD